MQMWFKRACKSTAMGDTRYLDEVFIKIRASHYREFRGRAFAGWQLATCAQWKRELNKLSMLLIQDR